MKLQELEFQVLLALDSLREAEIATKRDDAMGSLKLGDVPFLRLRCEAAVRSYKEALEALGFDLASRELRTDAVKNHCPEAKDTRAIGHYCDATSSNFCAGDPDRALDSAVALYALPEDVHRMTHEYWYQEKQRLKTLMISLRACETQNPLILLRVHAEEEGLFAVLSHQRTQAEAESSKSLARYKESLNRLACLLIEMDALSMQLDQTNAAIDLDMKATATLRAEIARRSPRY